MLLASLAVVSFLINIGSFGFIGNMAGYEDDGRIKVPFPDETYNVSPYMYFLSRICNLTT